MPIRLTSTIGWSEKVFGGAAGEQVNPNRPSLGGLLS
jgi:hypothetical protein